MPSQHLKELKKEIYEVRLLLDGLSAYHEIPPPIVELAISKTEQLKELLLALKTETAIKPDALNNNEATKAPFVIEKTIIEDDAKVDEIIPQPTPIKKEVVAENTEIIIEEEVLMDASLAESTTKEFVEIQDQQEPTTSVNTPLLTTTKNTTLGKTVLADSIASNKKVMNDVMPDTKQHTLGKKIEKSAIPDLKRAIPINDRFRFQRDLFGNNVSLFNETLATLNVMPTVIEAETFVTQNFKWDMNSASAQDFLALLNRRFVK